MKLRFFELAKRASAHSNHPDHPMGSVIVRGNKVISIGFNSCKTHTRSTHPFKGTHAELSAILKAREDVRGCSIYIYRATKNGNLGLAKPCQWCQTMLKEAGITTWYYSDVGGYKEEKV